MPKRATHQVSDRRGAHRGSPARPCPPRFLSSYPLPTVPNLPIPPWTRVRLDPVLHAPQELPPRELLRIFPAHWRRTPPQCLRPASAHALALPPDWAYRQHSHLRTVRGFR